MSGTITKTVLLSDIEGIISKRTLKANYDEKTDRFKVRVPAHLFGGCGSWQKSGNGPWTPSVEDESIYAKSPAELFKVVEKASVDYVESLKKRTKVIGYSVRYEIGYGVDVPKDARRSNEDHFNRSHEGTSLRIEYRILWKIEVGGNATFRRDESGSGYEREPDQWVEWTQEREDFFQKTEEALAALSLRFEEFFNRDSKTLGSRIEASPKTLLLGLEEKRSKKKEEVSHG